MIESSEKIFLFFKTCRGHSFTLTRTGVNDISAWVALPRGVSPYNVVAHKVAPQTKFMQEIEKFAFGICSKLSKILFQYV